MNFSKVFLFLFSLIMMVTLILLVGAIDKASPMVYWTFLITSVLNFIVNTYITYNVSFDAETKTE
jgi:hypothetical protein